MDGHESVAPQDAAQEVQVWSPVDIDCSDDSAFLGFAMSKKMKLTYIFHSGFVLETEQSILVFDY